MPFSKNQRGNKKRHAAKWITFWKECRRGAKGAFALRCVALLKNSYLHFEFLKLQKPKPKPKTKTKWNIRFGFKLNVPHSVANQLNKRLIFITERCNWYDTSQAATFTIQKAHSLTSSRTQTNTRQNIYTNEEQRMNKNVKGTNECCLEGGRCAKLQHFRWVCRSWNLFDLLYVSLGSIPRCPPKKKRIWRAQANKFLFSW